MKNQPFYLVLDIDETLGHCITPFDFTQQKETPEARQNYEYFKARAIQEEREEEQGLLTWQTRQYFRMQQLEAVFKRRPFWFEFIHRMVKREQFEIIIWSAGTRGYVREVTYSILFPKIFSNSENISPFAVFCRDHMAYDETAQCFIKPLKAVSGLLRLFKVCTRLPSWRLILVDNLPINALQNPHQFVHVADYRPSVTRPMDDDRELLLNVPDKCLLVRDHITQVRNTMYNNQMKSISNAQMQQHRQPQWIAKQQLLDSGETPESFAPPSASPLSITKSPVFSFSLSTPSCLDTIISPRRQCSCNTSGAFTRVFNTTLPQKRQKLNAPSTSQYNLPLEQKTSIMLEPYTEEKSPMDMTVVPQNSVPNEFVFNSGARPCSWCNSAEQMEFNLLDPNQRVETVSPLST